MEEEVKILLKAECLSKKEWDVRVFDDDRNFFLIEGGCKRYNYTYGGSMCKGCQSIERKLLKYDVSYANYGRTLIKISKKDLEFLSDKLKCRQFLSAQKHLFVSQKNAEHEYQDKLNDLTKKMDEMERSLVKRLDMLEDKLNIVVSGLDFVK